jgi:hypothetical protein
MVKFTAVLACACALALLPAAHAGYVNDHPALAKDLIDVKGLRKREKRLHEGPVIKLYHQTSEWACKAIMKTTFYPGFKGIAGGGIYFAFSGLDTMWKAQKWGCMIAAWVAIGKSKNLTYNGDGRITAKIMLETGFDSAWMPRGCDGPPCMPPPQPEQVIYFSDQILQMTAYPCERNGKVSGEYYAEPLSEEAPRFNHSEGLSSEQLRKIRGREESLFLEPKPGPPVVVIVFVAMLVSLLGVLLYCYCDKCGFLFVVAKEKQAVCDKPQRMIIVDSMKSSGSDDDEDPVVLCSVGRLDKLFIPTREWVQDELETSMDQRLLGKWHYVCPLGSREYSILRSQKNKQLFFFEEGVGQSGDLTEHDGWMVAQLQRGKIRLRLERDAKGDFLRSTFITIDGETGEEIVARKAREGD